MVKSRKTKNFSLSLSSISFSLILQQLSLNLRPFLIRMLFDYPISDASPNQEEVVLLMEEEKKQLLFSNGRRSLNGATGFFRRVLHFEKVGPGPRVCAADLH